MILAFELVKLSDVGGRLHITDWRVATWASCPGCSESMYGPVDDGEIIYEDDPLVCAECGEVCSAGVEEKDEPDEPSEFGPPSQHVGQAWVRELERPQQLRPTALAGFRRLLRLDPRSDQTGRKP